MIAAVDPPRVDLGPVVGGALASLAPLAPWLAVVTVVVALLRFPIPGRGAGLLARRDPWRLFKYEARRLVMERAGGRCEGPVLLLWGRCGRPAEEADHVYPWSRGGATVPSNGQALCRRCNRSKSNLRPAWWYVVGLERRRRAYFPPGSEVRVAAALTAVERAAHTTGPVRRRTRTR